MRGNKGKIKMRYTDIEIEQEAMLILRGHTIRAVSAILGVPVSTVHSHMHTRLKSINETKAIEVSKILSNRKSGKQPEWTKEN